MNEKTYLSIEEIISLPILSDPSISDDGKNVAFVKKTADWKDNKYRNHVWIYEKDKRQSYRITSENIDSTYPLWSLDSRNIAYLSPAGDEDNKKNQIFVKSIDGSNRVQITAEKEGINKFKWNPSGKGFYYVAPSKESEAIKKRKELYGDFQRVGKEYQNDCLYYIEIEKMVQKDKPAHGNSAVYQLTEGERLHINEYDVSNDGKKIVFTAAPSSNMEDYINGNLYILDINTGELQKVDIDTGRERLLFP